MSLEIINRRLNLMEFKQYVSNYNFGILPANKLVIHHTWRPTVYSWDGERTIQGLKRYYEGKGWPAGPHLFIAEDGIWLFSPMQKNGIHAGELNNQSIGIEVVGDYDNEIWSGETKYNALGTITVLMEKLGVKSNQINFHRDVSSKSCPGHAITKQWLADELNRFRFRPGLPGSTSVFEAITSISAPIPAPIPTGLSALDDEVMIPVWAADAVSFVHKYKLFEVRTHEDVRDAVKFQRLYNLIQNS